MSTKEMVHDLVKNKIRLLPAVLKDIGEQCRFHQVSRGTLFKIYSSFNECGLDIAYRCFVKKEMDSRGRFLEYRFVQWLAKRHKEIKDWKFREKIRPFGEFDIVGIDENNEIIIIAECKSRKGKAKRAQLDKWIDNAKMIKQKDGIADDLKEAYFVNISGYTRETLDRLLERKDITSDFKLKTGKVEKVKLALCEEREGNIKQHRIQKS